MDLITTPGFINFHQKVGTKGEEIYVIKVEFAENEFGQRDS